MVQNVALAFLGCWALIVPTLVTHFQHDDRPIFLDVVAHVKIDTSLFQMALRNVRAMLPQGVHSHVPPFENLMVESYPQLQASLAKCLYEQEFVSLLVDVPSEIM
jgi:hypothetical protein